jgi:Cu-Zn family superoxide dismutase
MSRTLSVFAVACLVGTAAVSAQMKHVDLKDAKGATVGMAMISPAKGGGVSIEIDVKGLPPGEHAVHLHEVAKCEPPFTSAGEHFNPTKRKHGSSSPDGPHAGDLPNLTVAANGAGKATVTNKNLAMGPGANSIYGTAIVIHGQADDMKTDPAGNSGDRIVCGTITQ